MGNGGNESGEGSQLDASQRLDVTLRSSRGIRGLDFVWAATGSTLKAYSWYPVVKKAHARRLVVVSGGGLQWALKGAGSRAGATGAALSAAHGEDDVARLVLRFDVPRRRDYVLQRIAPVDDRPVPSRFDWLLE